MTKKIFAVVLLVFCYIALSQLQIYLTDPSEFWINFGTE